jgi:virulence-associated protein VapD
MKNNFLKEVKKIFPNATKETIKIHKDLMKLDFCWCYGEVSINNYPIEYHKQIIKINQLAREI